MFNKKILSAILATTVLTTVYAPSALISNSSKVYADTTTIQNAIQIINAASLTSAQKDALVKFIQTYISSTSHTTTDTLFNQLTIDQQKKLADKFGITPSSLNAFLGWFKTYAVSDANKFLAMTDADKAVQLQTWLDDATAYMKKNAGVTDEQASRVAKYTNMMLSMAPAAQLFSFNANGTLVYDSQKLDIYLSLANAAITANGSTDTISDTDVIKKVIDILVSRYNNETDSTLKSAAKQFLISYGIAKDYTAPTSNNDSASSGSLTQDTQKALSELNTVLSNLNPKDENAVDALKNKVQDFAAKALDIIPTVEVKNNVASVAVDKSTVTAALTAITDVIAKAKLTGVDVAPAKLTVTIDIPKDKTADVTSVQIPQDLLKQVADAKVFYAAVKTEEGQVAVPVSILNTGKDVSIKVAKVTSEAVKNALENSKVKLGGKVAPVVAYNYEIKSGSDVISQFATPVEVTLNADDTKLDKIVNKVFYIAEDGSLKHIGGTWASGKITFPAKHFSQYALLGYTKEFNDIANNWIKTQPARYLDQAVVRLIANGDTKGNFNPDNKIKRSEFAAMLVRALGLNTKSYSAAFTDVKNGAWYTPEVEAAQATGLVSGVGNNKFEPDRAITREEMAKMITNAYSKLTGKSVSDIVGTSNSKFTDFSNVTSWAKNYVKALENLSVLDGYADGSFKPASSATRAETVKTIVELLNKSEEL